MNRLTESETKKANMLASMIDCSPHEWPRSVDEIVLVCHGYLDRVADNQNLRERLAAVEAERDAALKRATEARETADNYAGHCNEACKQLEVVEAERDAARAGEARAVEALRTIRGADIHPDADGLIEDFTCFYCHRNSVDGCDDDCPRVIAAHVIDLAQPALAWLAQQRREAAAEVVNALADGCDRAKRPILAQELRGHVAALLAGAEALERMEAMESSSSTMLPKSASASEGQ